MMGHTRLHVVLLSLGDRCFFAGALHATGNIWAGNIWSRYDRSVKQKTPRHIAAGLSVLRCSPVRNRAYLAFCEPLPFWLQPLSLPFAFWQAPFFWQAPLPFWAAPFLPSLPLPAFWQGCRPFF